MVSQVLDKVIHGSSRFVLDDKGVEGCLEASYLLIPSFLTILVLRMSFNYTNSLGFA